ncbi:unnamed protein product [Prunus brigantina]
MNSRGNAIQNFFNDDSDDVDLHQQRVAMAVQHHTFLLEQYAQQSKRGGSVAGCEYKNWKREKHHKSLMEDYFCERPLYPPVDFRRRRLWTTKFIPKAKANNHFSNAPIWMLSKLHRQVLLDWMHWEWKDCPTAWAGQFTDYKHKPTIVLEPVASYDTWIWHAFFGVAGSNNDINVLARSPLFNDVVNGVSPYIQYVVNGNEYNMGYYLDDGIYPRWATLVKTISQPDTPKKRLFAQKQEAYRKDVERALGILQAQ